MNKNIRQIGEYKGHPIYVNNGCFLYDEETNRYKHLWCNLKGSHVEFMTEEEFCTAKVNGTIDDQAFEFTLQEFEDEKRYEKSDKSPKFNDRVDKAKGYKFPGTVVSFFRNLKGERRYVVEMENYGLLHIFNEEQLIKT